MGPETIRTIANVLVDRRFDCYVEATAIVVRRSTGCFQWQLLEDTGEGASLCVLQTDDRSTNFADVSFPSRMTRLDARVAAETIARYGYTAALEAADKWVQESSSRPLELPELTEPLRRDWHVQGCNPAMVQRMLATWLEAGSQTRLVRDAVEVRCWIAEALAASGQTDVLLATAREHFIEYLDSAPAWRLQSADPISTISSMASAAISSPSEIELDAFVELAERMSMTWIAKTLEGGSSPRVISQTAEEWLRDTIPKPEDPPNSGARLALAVLVGCALPLARPTAAPARKNLIALLEKGAEQHIQRAFSSGIKHRKSLAAMPREALAQEDAEVRRARMADRVALAVRAGTAVRNQDLEGWW